MTITQEEAIQAWMEHASFVHREYDHQRDDFVHVKIREDPMELLRSNNGSVYYNVPTGFWAAIEVNRNNERSFHVELNNRGQHASFPLKGSLSLTSDGYIYCCEYTAKFVENNKDVSVFYCHSMDPSGLRHLEEFYMNGRQGLDVVLTYNAGNKDTFAQRDRVKEDVRRWCSERNWIRELHLGASRDDMGSIVHL